MLAAPPIKCVLAAPRNADGRQCPVNGSAKDVIAQSSIPRSASVACSRCPIWITTLGRSSMSVPGTAARSSMREAREAGSPRFSKADASRVPPPITLAGTHHWRCTLGRCSIRNHRRSYHHSCRGTLGSPGYRNPAAGERSLRCPYTDSDCNSCRHGSDLERTFAVLPPTPHSPAINRPPWRAPHPRAP